MEDSLWAGLSDSYAKLPMALTAEKLGEQYGITREQCDEFALTSQQRWSNGNYTRCSLSLLPGAHEKSRWFSWAPATTWLGKFLHIIVCFLHIIV